MENDFRSQLAHYHFQIKQQLSLLDLYQKQLQQLEQILAIQLKAYSNAEESFTTVLELKQKLISIAEKKVAATTQLHHVIAQIKFLTESPIHHEK